jgi:hypothetical protein
LESVHGIAEAEKGIPAIIQILKTRIKNMRGIAEAKKGFSAIIRKIRINLSQFLKKFYEPAEKTGFNVALIKTLTDFCNSLDKPLVILFDEVDCLSNGTLISFLRQLRDGYINRSNGIPFVHSIALVGMRNIRDYKAKIRDDRETLGGASPFHIISETLTLRNFTIEEIIKLYAQHTEQTQQIFSTEVSEKIYHYTQGQPWLVNAIAREIVVKILKLSQTIEPKHVEQAIQTIILRRDTHIDSLMERLKESRVQRIVEPVILGKIKGYSVIDDDYQYILDIGLLRLASNKLVPSNPIYGEVIIRTLSSRTQMEMDERNYLKKPALLVDGKLDMKQLLSAFQTFWRENSEIWVERYQYKEAAPHLILQAFLQKLVNSGGRISRELAGGTERLDLCIHYEGVNYPIELKLRYSEKTYKKGLVQLAGYMDKLDCSEGWLIIFDRRKNTPWRKKIFWKTHKKEDKTIYLVGC